jgi:hypothetical protein
LILFILPIFEQPTIFFELITLYCQIHLLIF